MAESVTTSAGRAATVVQRRTWVTDQVVLLQRPDVMVSALPPMARWIYRGDPGLIGEEFGVALPVEPCRAATAGDRAALWLGPDEWLLLAPEAEVAGGDALGRAAAAPGSNLHEELREAVAGEPASLVDVSHRNAALDVTGPKAELLLASACLLDLADPAFPVGMVARTILGKAEIVLWRREAATFRLETQRSFAPYLAALLGEAAHGLD